jgi:maltooligosyltrehalose trehalohydrolase
MNFMPIHQLGIHVHDKHAHVGVFFPGLTPTQGFQVKVRVIHEKDQFIQSEQPFTQAMNHSINPEYGDYWDTTLDLTQPGQGKRWGQPGKYVYRFMVITPENQTIDWIIDPFAREFGTGRHGAFTLDYQDHQWDNSETTWKIPASHDLVMYELNLMEFAGSLTQAIQKLDYLQDLGVTSLSLMPVTNVTKAIDWGYTPIGYFGVDERFGKRCDFQEFVENAHQRGMAVLVDAIYGHTSDLFAYEYLYSRLPGIPNPMMGSFSGDDFGPSVDWKLTFAQDFFNTVNRHWLQTYHIDGFRYDCVPNYWELEPTFRGYASIAYHTYQWVKTQVLAQNPDYLRFKEIGVGHRLIQCAEQLQAVKSVLEHTYSTCTWQNSTLGAAQKVASGSAGALPEFGQALGAADLPTERTVNEDHLNKAPLQYIENHDHSRFICEFGTYNTDEEANPLFEQGDRTRWTRLQPYLIGMLLSKGIPLLWQGQELCENNTVASSGPGRIGFLRQVHWEYFYSEEGRSTLALVRKLIKLRQHLDHVKQGEHFYFNHDQQYSDHGVLLFARYFPGTPDYTLVALNFTDTAQWVPFWFPVGGTYREQLHGTENPGLDLVNVQAHNKWWIEVPSNYGRVWTHG